MPSPRIYSENENLMHFITITAIEWIDIFTKPEYFKVIISSLEFCRNNKGLLLYDYVIMSNHIHLIVRAKEAYKLSEIIRDFKRFTTKNILELLQKDNRRYIINLLENSYKRNKENNRQVWQRENYPETISSEKFYIEKSKYIQLNPVRKKYVELAEHWLYSSAKVRLFDESGVIELDNLYK